MKVAARKNQTSRAIALSIFLHILLILGIAAILSIRPEMPIPPEPEEAMEITMIPPPAPKTTEPTYLSTTEAQRSEKPPENPAFESDKDTQAASERPAEGEAPLPSQQGEDAPGAEFANQEYTPGKEAQPSAPSTPPTPAATPEATPLPRPKESEIALLDPVKPSQKKVEPTAPKPPSPPTPQLPPGYQPQTRITRLKGNISNRGRASAAAAATPLGRFKKQISDAIGSRWYYYVNESIGLLNPGTVEIRFVVAESGKVSKVEVLRNSSNESFAATSVRAVADAEIPPIPADILPMLQNGSIEVEYTFTILSN